jgi:shikimate kinase
VIHLIGFSGVGKSTIAPLLSELLEKPFIDLDEEVTKRTGKRPALIFSKFGQGYYRAVESDTLKDIITKYPDYILVTGGGTVIPKDNRDLLKKTGTVVYLTADPEIIVNRIRKSYNKHDASLPLLNAIEMNRFLNRILQFREVFYLDIADLIIPTDNLTPFEIAQNIVSKF